MDIENLILFHNNPERAKIYNIVANKLYSALDLRNAETILLCSYLVNTMIEEGRLIYNENFRTEKS